MEDKETVRTWRSIDGSVLYDATFEGLYKNDKVKLRKVSNGSVVAVPMSRLSEEDRSHVADRTGALSPQSPVVRAFSAPVTPSLDVKVTLKDKFKMLRRQSVQPLDEGRQSGDEDQSSSPDNHSSHNAFGTSLPPSPFRHNQVKEVEKLHLDMSSISASSNTRTDRSSLSGTTTASSYEANDILSSSIRRGSSSSFGRYEYSSPGTGERGRLETIADSPVKYKIAPVEMTSTGAVDIVVERISVLRVTNDKHWVPDRSPQEREIDLEWRPNSPIVEQRSRRKSKYFLPHLSKLPPAALLTISQRLDILSRIRFYNVKKTIQTVLQQIPESWQHLYFDEQQSVEHPFVVNLIRYLVTKRLQEFVHVAVFDRTNISEYTVITILRNLPNLFHLSIKGCLSVHSYPLANRLIYHAKQQTFRLPELGSFHFGSALPRGKIQEGEPCLVESTSFGRDVGLIGLSLTQLSGHDIDFDIYLCEHCDLGSCYPVFECSFCGPRVGLKKCFVCAPKCDACGLRGCRERGCLVEADQVPNVHSPAYDSPNWTLSKNQICALCRRPILLCNYNHCSTLPSCSTCGVFMHRRCSYDRVNECTKCRTMVCPFCRKDKCKTCNKDLGR